MPIPVEAVYPLVITGVALAFGGFALDHTHRFFNNGKPKRLMIDQWDKKMMARDERITGSITLQLDPTTGKKW